MADTLIAEVGIERREKTAVIDCDVHVTMKSGDMWFQYLAEEWHDYHRDYWRSRAHRVGVSPRCAKCRAPRCMAAFGTAGIRFGFFARAIAG